MTFVAAGAVTLERPAKAEPAAIFTAGLVVASLCFNFVLCFVNTRLFSVNTGVVMAAEMALIGSAFVLVLRDNQPLYAVLAAYLSYAVFLASMQGALDMKSVRDVLIPIAFVFVGRRFGDPAMGDRLVALCVWIVLVVGLFEFFFLTQYLKFIDIFAYYVSRGTISSAAADTTGTHLFASGIRPEGRSLLPFLGDHRVSSVFLEPVSVGNFGAIAFSWTVLRNFKRPLLMMLKLLPIVAIFILADARFGLMVSLSCFVVFPIAKSIGRVPMLLAPFVALWLLAVVGILNANVAWDNGLGGRVMLSGQMLSGLDLSEVLAFVPVTRFVSDSGYTYLLAKTGLIGFAGLWGLFILYPVSNDQEWRFRVFVAVYIMALLTISNSLYSIKTAALLWYLVGCIAVKQSVGHIRRQ
ncbi:surface polysaccharide polymerase [Rhodoblastus acidophilus]|uniref:Surface polysaccharide polymerase n=1 Tax=Rhodoblastus acidophilus TaxID=1074 RepID=A0A6N8DQC6_RHOAC|nr:surface polysaccharide polymerase [Rhodoblastus acidophilus]MCW2275856.1 putative polymerase [Rhodoblastus acidophilus]MTV32498.1 surface polysaccharide polymerase [Rhodoblastus acidophilus]